MPDNKATVKAVAKANARLATAKLNLEKAIRSGQGEAVARYDVVQASAELSKAIAEYDK